MKVYLWALEFGFVIKCKVFEFHSQFLSLKAEDLFDSGFYGKGILSKSKPLWNPEK